MNAIDGFSKIGVWAHRPQDNPFADLDRQPHRPSGEFDILSPEEVAALIRSAASEQDAALFAVAAYAGLRLGELRGLTWADLDFADRLVHVRRAYVRGAFKVPKSGRVRSVPMIDQVTALGTLLLDHLELEERSLKPVLGRMRVVFEPAASSRESLRSRAPVVEPGHWLPAIAD